MQLGKYLEHEISTCLKNLDKFGGKVFISLAKLVQNSGRCISHMFLKLAYVFEGGDPVR